MPWRSRSTGGGQTCRAPAARGAAGRVPGQPFPSLHPLARTPPARGPAPTPRRAPRPLPDGGPGGGDRHPPRCLPRRGGAAAGREAPLTPPRAAAGDRMPPPPPPQRRARAAPVLPARPRPTLPPAGKRPRGAYPLPCTGCLLGGRAGHGRARHGVGAAALRPGRRCRGAGTRGDAAAPRTAPTYLTSRAPPPPRASRPHQRHVTGAGQSPPGSPLPPSHSESSPPPGDALQLEASQRRKVRLRCRLPARRGGAIGREPWRSAAGRGCPSALRLRRAVSPFPSNDFPHNFLF